MSSPIDEALDNILNNAWIEGKVSEGVFLKVNPEAKERIKALIAEVIGTDDKPTPNSNDYSDWTVCENCDVILDDLTDPEYACICTRRNQLRKEQRHRAGIGEL